MRSFLILALMFSLLGCADIGLQRNSAIDLKTLFTASITSREPVVLEANESKSDRVMIGFLAAGPIGAIATASTEEDFSSPKAFNYTFTLTDGSKVNVKSFSMVEVGECAEVISPNDSDIEIVRGVERDKCRYIE